MNWALYEIRSTQNTSSMTLLLDVLWPCAVWTVFFPSWHLRQKRAHRDGGGGVWWVAGEDLIGAFPLPEIRNLKERDYKEARNCYYRHSPQNISLNFSTQCRMNLRHQASCITWRRYKRLSSLSNKNHAKFIFHKRVSKNPLTIFTDNFSSMLEINWPFEH